MQSTSCSSLQMVSEHQNKELLKQHNSATLIKGTIRLINIFIDSTMIRSAPTTTNATAFQESANDKTQATRLPLRRSASEIRFRGNQMAATQPRVKRSPSLLIGEPSRVERSVRHLSTVYYAHAQIKLIKPAGERSGDAASDSAKRRHGNLSISRSACHYSR